MFDNLRQRWAASGHGTRIGFFVGLLAIVLLFAWLVSWTMRDNYQVLFSDLDAKDAATIVGELERMKVAYRLEEGGKSILVDKDAVYKTRLKLMGKGVNLRGTVGFEIFNNTDFGTTEFAQKINFQRALQGELARTIMDIDDVKFARVHLVMPESGLFKKNNVKPKASISVIMRGDRQLGQEQVLGIQRLVAAAVPEIDASAVTILDQRGVALTRAQDGDSDAGAAGSRLETKKQIEVYLTRKIADMLDKAVGAGQAIVSVDVALTQDHVKITREDVIPISTHDGENVGAVTRRRQSQQNMPSAREVGLATSGVATDPAGEPLKGTVRGQGSGTLEIEYQNGRKIEQVVSTPGNIKRISVGVLLPNSVDPEQLDKIRDVVSMAAGVSAARGDSIALYSIDQYAVKSRTATPAAANAAAVTQDDSASAPSPRDAGVSHPLWIVLAVAVILAFGTLLLRGTKKRQAFDDAVPQLSEAERLEALEHVRQWMNGATVTSKNEATV